MVVVCTELQTIQVTYQQICSGEDPWIALGNFINDFFGNFPELRAELVREQIELPVDADLEKRRWYVFCVATVEYLCREYDVSCPLWVLDSTCGLDEPWYYSLGAHKQVVRERLERQTPEAFRRRGIYCGNRMFLNKYERAEKIHQIA
jgi:hypothetical protein